MKKENYINIYFAIALFMILNIEYSILSAIGEVRPSYVVGYDHAVFSLILAAFYFFGYMHRHTKK